MEELIPDVWVKIAGLGAFGLIGVYVLTNFQEWIRAKWRKSNGNRRTESPQHWTFQMVELMGEMNSKMDRTNKLLENGLHADIKELKDLAKTCARALPKA